ncbi:hypothetical protein HAX54_050354 [Datura stramonium]|uniref:Uncharacterized protein n=1 Tax=Datura stramonium TaxID=4076 RepID=A0ABS8SWV0_DATST|nr:hypothetical protein [Datura stramonium]
MLTLARGGENRFLEGEEAYKSVLLGSFSIDVDAAPLFYLVSICTKGTSSQLCIRHFLVTNHLLLLDGQSSDAENTFPPSAWYDASGHLTLVSLDQPIL